MLQPNSIQNVADFWSNPPDMKAKTTPTQKKSPFSDFTSSGGKPFKRCLSHNNLELLKNGSLKKPKTAHWSSADLFKEVETFFITSKDSKEKATSSKGISKGSRSITRSASSSSLHDVYQLNDQNDDKRLQSISPIDGFFLKSPLTKKKSSPFEISSLDQYEDYTSTSILSVLKNNQNSASNPKSFKTDSSKVKKEPIDINEIDKENIDPEAYKEFYKSLNFIEKKKPHISSLKSNSHTSPVQKLKKPSSESEFEEFDSDDLDDFACSMALQAAEEDIKIRSDSIHKPIPLTYSAPMPETVINGSQYEP